MAETLGGRNMIGFRVTEDSIEAAYDDMLNSHTMSIDDAEKIVRLASSMYEGETLRLDSVTVTRGAPSGDTDDDPKVTFGDEVQSTPNPTVYVSDIEDAVDIADEIDAIDDDLQQLKDERDFAGFSTKAKAADGGTGTYAVTGRYADRDGRSNGWSRAVPSERDHDFHTHEPTAEELRNLQNKLDDDDLAQYSGKVVVATCGSYGAVVPVDADYTATSKDGELTFFFNADDDLSGDRFDSWKPLHRDYDSAAYVNTIKQLRASEAGDEL